MRFGRLLVWFWSPLFLGFKYGVKGYKVLDLTTQSIHISRDVHFYEHCFSFMPSASISTLDFSLISNSPYCDLRDDINTSLISNDVPSFVANDHTNVAAPAADTSSVDVLSDPIDVSIETSIGGDASTPINELLRRSSRPHIATKYVFTIL